MRTFLFVVLFLGADALIAFDRFYGLQDDMAMESWPTTDDGMIVAGLSISSTNFYSAWLVKLDSSGTTEWQK